MQLDSARGCRSIFGDYVRSIDVCCRERARSLQFASVSARLRIRCSILIVVWCSRSWFEARCSQCASSAMLAHSLAACLNCSAERVCRSPPRARAFGSKHGLIVWRLLVVPTRLFLAPLQERSVQRTPPACRARSQHSAGALSDVGREAWRRAAIVAFSLLLWTGPAPALLCGSASWSGPWDAASARELEEGNLEDT